MKLPLLLLAVTAFQPTHVQKSRSNEYAAVEIFIENCLKQMNIEVPINKKYWRSGRGVSGGGSSKECGNFSYAIDAMRQSRKQVSLHLIVSVNSYNVKKDLILVRGKKSEHKLEQGVKIIASY